MIERGIRNHARRKLGLVESQPTGLPLEPGEEVLSYYAGPPEVYATTAGLLWRRGEATWTNLKYVDITELQLPLHKRRLHLRIVARGQVHELAFGNGFCYTLFAFLAGARMTIRKYLGLDFIRSHWDDAKAQMANANLDLPASDPPGARPR